MKLQGHTFEFQGETLYFDVLNYQNGGATAVRVMTEDGVSYAMLTTNIPDAPLEEREIIVKTWSENEPISQRAKEMTEIFEDTGKRIPTGHVLAEVWRFKDGVELPPKEEK